MVISLPMTKEDFTPEAQESFLSAVAATAAVPRASVYIAKITEVTRSLSSKPCAGCSVQALLIRN